MKEIKMNSFIIYFVGIIGVLIASFYSSVLVKIIAYPVMVVLGGNLYSNGIKRKEFVNAIIIWIALAVLCPIIGMKVIDFVNRSVKLKLENKE